MVRIVIEGILPDLNTELNEAKRVCRVGKRRIPGLLYSKHKAKWTEAVAWYCKAQYRGRPISEPCAFVMAWYLPDKKKDPDNTWFAQKYIFDGLVAGGVLAQDRFHNLRGGCLHLPLIDSRNPRVEVYVLPGRHLKPEFLNLTTT